MHPSLVIANCKKLLPCYCNEMDVFQLVLLDFELTSAAKGFVNALLCWSCCGRLDALMFHITVIWTRWSVCSCWLDT